MLIRHSFMGLVKKSVQDLRELNYYFFSPLPKTGYQSVVG